MLRVLLDVVPRYVADVQIGHVLGRTALPLAPYHVAVEVCKPRGPRAAPVQSAAILLSFFNIEGVFISFANICYI